MTTCWTWSVGAFRPFRRAFIPAARRTTYRRSCGIWPSNSMLGSGPTTPQDYPERSGFGRRREREWGHGGTAAGLIRSPHLMRIYIIGNDGITLCRTAPSILNNGEIAVASNEELHAGAR